MTGLENTVAIVTGASSGLGAATVSELARAGADVVGIDLRVDPTYRAEHVDYLAADVTSEEETRHAVEHAARKGPIRIVVNCAGIAPAARVVGKDGPHPLDAFARTLLVNTTGTFNVVRLAATQMEGNPVVEGERGVIINTASVAAFDGQIGQAAYAASKAAVAGMTLPLARELARSLIRVVTIAPGVFETPMVDAFAADVQESLGRQVPHPNRLGRPSEFAGLVRHIVENPYINGETIRLDGAIRMAPR